MPIRRLCDHQIIQSLDNDDGTFDFRIATKNDGDYTYYVKPEDGYTWEDGTTNEEKSNGQLPKRITVLKLLTLMM